MSSDAATMAERVVARMHAAMNAHDVEAFVACFAEDYDSWRPSSPTARCSARRVPCCFGEHWRGPDRSLDAVLRLAGHPA